MINEIKKCQFSTITIFRAKSPVSFSDFLILSIHFTINFACKHLTYCIAHSRLPRNKR